MFCTPVALLQPYGVVSGLRVTELGIGICKSFVKANDFVAMKQRTPDEKLSTYGLALRAASNSSPGCHWTDEFAVKARHPRTKPNFASFAFPVKSMDGLYSSVG